MVPPPTTPTTFLSFNTCESSNLIYDLGFLSKKTISIISRQLLIVVFLLSSCLALFPSFLELPSVPSSILEPQGLRFPKSKQRESGRKDNVNVCWAWG